MHLPVPLLGPSTSQRQQNRLSSSLQATQLSRHLSAGVVSWVSYVVWDEFERGEVYGTTPDRIQRTARR